MKIASGVLLRAATGDDLQDVIAVGQQTWPVTYGPIAGEDYARLNHLAVPELIIRSSTGPLVTEAADNPASEAGKAAGGRRARQS